MIPKLNLVLARAYAVACQQNESIDSAYIKKTAIEILEKNETLSQLIPIAQRLEPRIDQEEEGILKLTLPPTEDARPHTPASQVWELRFQLPKAHNVVNTRDFLERYHRMQETALRLIHEKCLNDASLAKTLEQLEEQNAKFLKLIRLGATIDPKIIGAANRGDIQAKHYFRERAGNGLAALREYSRGIAQILNIKRQAFQKEEIKDATRKRPVFTNFMMTGEKIVAETHAPQDIERMHASASEFEGGLHNHIQSIQETFSKDGLSLEDNYDITRSSTLSSIGLIREFLLFETPRSNPFISTSEINREAIEKRNKTTEGRRENLMLFKKLYQENVLNLLEKQAERLPEISSSEEKPIPVHFTLQTLLSPTMIPGLSIFKAIRGSPDRAMVEANAAAIYRYEGKVIQVGSKWVKFEPLYFNEGVNALRGNGGALEEMINARGLNQLDDLVFKENKTIFSQKICFTAQEQEKINTLMQEKRIIYDKLDLIKDATEYYQLEAKAKILEDKVNELHKIRLERASKVWASDEAKELFDDPQTTKQFKTLYLIHAHHQRNHGYTDYQEDSLLKSIGSFIKGALTFPKKRIIAKAVNTLKNTFTLGKKQQDQWGTPRKISWIIAKMAAAPLIVIGTTIASIVAAGLALVLPPLCLMAGKNLSLIPGLRADTLEIIGRTGLRQLGFYDNKRTYDGPTLMSSLMRQMKIPYHFTCKSGEDRTGAMDNKRKAYRLCELNNEKFDLNSPKDRATFTNIFEHMCEFSAGNQSNGMNVPAERLQISTSDIGGELNHDLAKVAAQFAKNAYKGSGLTRANRLLTNQNLIISKENIELSKIEMALREIAKNDKGEDAVKAQIHLDKITYIKRLIAQASVSQTQTLNEEINKELVLLKAAMIRSGLLREDARNDEKGGVRNDEKGDVRNDEKEDARNDEPKNLIFLGSHRKQPETQKQENDLSSENSPADTPLPPKQ